MYRHEIKKILLQSLSLNKVYVFVDGSHYKIIAIDKIFNNKSILERHKLIYAPLVKYIKNNMIHSISIHAFCPESWGEKNKLQ